MRDSENTSIYWLVGLQPILLYIFILALTTGSLIFNIGIGNWQFPLSLILLVFIVYRFCLKNNQLFLKATSIFGGLLILFFGISFCIFDVTFDGQSYHQEAILRLASGWNPIYEEIDKEILNTYAKGSWIVSAAIYKTLHFVEMAKIFHVLFMASIFCLSMAILSRIGNLNQWQVFILSLLLAFHPVAMGQSLCFYIDGELASLLTGLSLLTLLLISDNFNFLTSINFLLTIIGGIIISIINVKFTAFLPLISYMVAIFFFLLWQKRFPLLKKWLLAMGISITLGFCLIGFQPYGTNYLRYGNPIYPFNQKSVSTKIIHIPQALQGRNVIERNIASLFVESDNLGESPISIKFPFMIWHREVVAFNHPDTRIGGFGPAFQGVLTLTILVFVIFFYQRFSLHKEILYFFLWIVIPVLLFPNGWYARYVPHFYLGPVLILGYILSLPKSFVFLRYISYVLSIWLMINLILTSYDHIRYNINRSSIIWQTLKEQQKNNVVLQTKFDPMFEWSLKARLTDHNISFETITAGDTLACDNPQVFYKSYGEYCILDTIY